MSNEFIYVKISDGEASRPVYFVLRVINNGEREIMGLWVGKADGWAALWRRSVLELIDLVIGTLDPGGGRRQRWARRCQAPLEAFDSTRAGRFPMTVFLP